MALILVVRDVIEDDIGDDTLEYKPYGDDNKGDEPTMPEADEFDH